MTTYRATKQFLALLLLIAVSTPLWARDPLPIDQGKTGLLLTLRKLRTTARLMHTAAHPDDEDGGMLTLESRGRGVVAVQMTLTRGEGGQNAVGKEFGDELGMLRTLELLEADRYYGVEQRFSRVADFGFSKTAEETMQKWDAQHTALADLVRVIRTFRPEVVISRFIGDQSDGHGNHQASGILTRQAFRDAGDPTKFPEQITEGLQPFQPKKLYVRARAEDWNIELDVNQTDPLLGMSYVAWGWQGLKHQLSQGAANWQMPTRMWTSHYKLVDTTIPNYHPGHEKDFFDGIDTSLTSLAALVPDRDFVAAGLKQLDGYIDEASGVADKDPKAAAVPLLKGLNATEELIAKLEKSNLDATSKDTLLVHLHEKRNEFRDAANYALRVTLTATANLPSMSEVTNQAGQLWLAAVPKRSFELKTAWTGTDRLSVRVNGPVSVLPLQVARPKLEHELRSQEFTSLLAQAPYTRQYWHRDDPDRESIYHIDDPQYETLPLTPWPFVALGTYEYQGLKGVIESVVEVAQPKPHPLIVGPAYSVSVPQSTLVIPMDSGSHTMLYGSWMSNLPGHNYVSDVITRGSLGTNEGGKISHGPVPPATKSPVQIGLVYDGPGKRELDTYQTLSVVGAKDKESYDIGYNVVTRDDLGAAYYFRRATQPVSIVDVKLPRNLKIGYIMGVGDDIPDVLRSIGINLTIISPDELKAGDLSKYGTIVLGIRPYEGNAALRENNQRVLDYVKNGGTLMVQYVYQTKQFADGHYTPYPFTLDRNNRDRVTVEEAPVEILAPNDPIFHTPNQITQKDFDGWVQERALYCPTEWDSHYTPLLSSHDPNDPPEKGCLLTAKYGKGTYIFNSWAFFRQLPAGVPGAIRLYVNLLNAGHR